LFFYFVTCPCSSRTKRHDNLFVDDDDDDDDDSATTPPSLGSLDILLQKCLSPCRTV